MTKLKMRFFKYVSLSVLSMLSLSFYILVDTYFISVAEGSNGIAALNISLPVYGILYGIGNMIGVGFSTRFKIKYDDYEEEAVVEKQPKSVGESYARNSSKLSLEKEKSNIVTMPNISRFLISIREPITFDDGTQVLDDVLKGKVVVLNLEMLEVDKKRQIFDFVSGGIYSLSGKIQKVTKDIFILAPKGIDIDGKVKDQIENNGFYQI